jgi:hypothetical protein
LQEFHGSLAFGLITQLWSVRGNGKQSIYDVGA